MSIIDLTYFQKANGLNIPLSISAPTANTSVQSPNSQAELTLLIDSVEKSILQNSLGLQLYNLFISALADIDNPVNARFKKLLQGEEYNNKVWEGLESEDGLLAWKVYEQFQIETNSRLTSAGNVMNDPEKSKLVTPAYKIANASQLFVKKYQEGYLIEPIVNGIFIDWIGCETDVNYSLYSYLMAKKTDFPEWDISYFRYFRYYEELNSFGI